MHHGVLGCRPGPRTYSGVRREDFPSVGVLHSLRAMTRTPHVAQAHSPFRAYARHSTLIASEPRPLTTPRSPASLPHQNRRPYSNGLDNFSCTVRALLFRAIEGARSSCFATCTSLGIRDPTQQPDGCISTSISPRRTTQRQPSLHLHHLITGNQGQGLPDPVTLFQPCRSRSC